MINNQPNPNVSNPKRIYDLAERTLRLSKRIIDLANDIPKNVITLPLINQFIRSGTSIGANYAEAEEASSKKDFVNKIAIANKETKETKYWLRLITHSVPDYSHNAQKL